MVIDFCGLERKQIKDVIKSLKNRIRLFVYISSDDIYRVCDQSLCLNKSVSEDDALRPFHDDDIIKMNKKSKYGNKKLRCEEYLYNHVKDIEDGFPYIILRPSNIIGPFDRTNRYWLTMNWIFRSSELSLHWNDKYNDKIMSFCFSEDISSLITTFLPKIEEGSKNNGENEFIMKVHGEAFNLSMDQKMNLKEFNQLVVSLKQLLLIISPNP